MNRITGEDAAQPREVLQVTLDGTPEICAATALMCIGYQFLRGFVAARQDAERSAQHIAAATELADKVIHHLPPQVVNAAHRKFHPEQPNPDAN